ncbi:MAG: response regulator transcription factor [Anaerolineales bacterium]|nr:response regulator transcription factor [Anaerolineales bacterium]
MTIEILLADDHQVLREGLKSILEKEPDLKIAGQAGNGRQAVQLCRNLDPDVVLMDINMPELNGVEATREIMRQQKEIQVIILSMYATKEHIYQAFQAGARGYLLKETSGLEVVDAIHEVARGNRFLSKALTEQMIDDYLLVRDPANSASPLDSLSERERQVLGLVAEGKTSKEIASSLHLSLSTVSTYRSRLMKKLGVEDLTELIKFAVEHRLI